MTTLFDTARSRLELLCTEMKEADPRISDAKIAQLLEFSPQKLNKLLSLQVRIGPKEAEKIADIFDVSLAWIYGESEIRQRLSPELQGAIKQLMITSKL